MNMRTVARVVLGILIGWSLLPAQNSAPAPFHGLEFLLGKWNGIAAGKTRRWAPARAPFPSNRSWIGKSSSAATRPNMLRDLATMT